MVKWSEITELAALPNSHGAVVAREYGIPAVVGVPLATEQLSSGDPVTVKGTA